MGYITIKNRCENSFIEKHSEFIGYLCPVQTPEQAVEFINEIKSKHRKAKHNVYAYILRDNNISRYSDDGEPQGTAGIPVLDVLKKRGLTDVCCVVTRYFGGVLLGGGGLVRAYTHAASIAADNAQIMKMCECYRLTVNTDYSLYGKIDYIISQSFETKLISSNFGNDVSVEILVKKEDISDFENKITDISNGKAVICKSQLIFEDFA